jgi:hypothetical protein
MPSLSSYDNLSVRSLISFVIFAVADSLSQLIYAGKERSRRRERIDASDVDLGGNWPLPPDLDGGLGSLTSTPPWDHARSLRFGLFGALVHAPACSFFFGALDSRLPGRGWGEVSFKLAADRATLAPALLLAALLWMRAPLGLLLLSLSGQEGGGGGGRSAASSGAGTSCLETLYEQGKTKTKTKKKEKEEEGTSGGTSRRELAATAVGSAFDDALRRLPRSYLLSCLFWVPAHSLGFAAVAARWRVLYVALASLVWNCVLAGISSEELLPRRGGGASSSSSSFSLPLFDKRQTRKARWSSDSTATTVE